MSEEESDLEYRLDDETEIRVIDYSINGLEDSALAYLLGLRHAIKSGSFDMIDDGQPDPTELCKMIAFLYAHKSSKLEGEEALDCARAALEYCPDYEHKNGKVGVRIGLTNVVVSNQGVDPYQTEYHITLSPTPQELERSKSFLRQARS
ncbi:MAG: hypothetical protein QF824_03405 [Candidatus Woesearchaeota archaeon]|jgi:hypothetical protein|nr:hypothetical protein [Candidatus Woesearchaeota archaeon]MDP7180290.1 hypothetical protein [Candidatus Woesearchaeota archaeon]